MTARASCDERVRDVESEPGTATEIERTTLEQWSSVVFAYLLVPLILFGTSRDLAWPQAWWFSALVLVVGVGGRALAERRHPGLMAERQRLGRNQGVKSWDKVLAPLMAVSLLYPHAVVAGLDRSHGWTASFPLWVQSLAFVFVLLGYLVGVWAIVENRYFSAVVRIQTDRGHEVCDTGPYRYIRHPGYAGNVLSSFLIPFLLDSWWVLIPAVIALVIAVVRTALEDRTLIDELPGYQDYASRVRYRLFPLIW